MSDITYNQRVAFKKDWNVGKFKISASTRSIIAALFGSNFQIESCCDTPQLLIGIIFHCVGSVSMSLLGNGVVETTVIILIIQMAYVYTSIITLTFIKRYFEELMS
ncbi:Transmembrane protein [Entamoeba marina]